MQRRKGAQFIRAYGAELFPTKLIRVVSGTIAVIALAGTVLDSNLRFLWIAAGLTILVCWQIYQAYRAAQLIPDIAITVEVTRPVGVHVPGPNGDLILPGRFVRLLLSNNGGPEAKSLHCTLEFRGLDGSKLFSERFPARWAGKRQLSASGDPFQHIGREELDMDLPSNSRDEPIDVLVSFDQPGSGFSAFVWNNDSMLGGSRPIGTSSRLVFSRCSQS